VLLSELKQQQAAPTGSEQRKENIAATDQAAGGDSASEASAGTQKSAAAQVRTVDEASQDKSRSVAEVSATTEPVKQVDQVAAVAKKTVPVAASTDKTPGSTGCYTLGPFRDLDKLRSLTREIKSYVVEADFRGREEKEPTLYWVYVNPEKNRKKAIETGNRLKAKKIKDFYVIRDGEKENGLSLGHFRNKDGAYRLAKKVRNLGFDVSVETVLKTYTIYWLDYQLSSGATIPEQVFDKYMSTADKDKITRIVRDCKR
jgi:hypothetical protein